MKQLFIQCVSSIFHFNSLSLSCIFFQQAAEEMIYDADIYRPPIEYYPYINIDEGQGGEPMFLLPIYELLIILRGTRHIMLSVN